MLCTTVVCQKTHLEGWKETHPRGMTAQRQWTTQAKEGVGMEKRTGCRYLRNGRERERENFPLFLLVTKLLDVYIPLRFCTLECALFHLSISNQWCDLLTHSAGLHMLTAPGYCHLDSPTLLLLDTACCLALLYQAPATACNDFKSC